MYRGNRQLHHSLLATRYPHQWCDVTCYRINQLLVSFQRYKFTRMTSSSAPSLPSTASSSTSTIASAPSSNYPRLITGQEATAIDQELMNPNLYAFELSQLMELAGLACAQAIHHVYFHRTAASPKRILVVCGPGNNGGDGLVVCRHLLHFVDQLHVTVLYPSSTSTSPPKQELFAHLLKQVSHLGAEIVLGDQFSSSSAKDSSSFSFQSFASFDLIIDAIFGFSFDATRPIRSPYDAIIRTMIECKCKIVALDVPSGWSVNDGPVQNSSSSTYLQPEMLISLTAPKLCARHFTGKYHALGGKFVPRDLAQRYRLNLPTFEGTQQFMMLPATIPSSTSSAHASLL